MKCPGCGSNLTIDDEKCLFCGQENPFAKKHRREMRHFTKEFNKTKEEVIQKSSHVNNWAVKITLIAVLVALNLVMLFLIGNTYEIHKYFRAKEILSEYSIHKNELDTMEENREYFKLANYWNDMDLYYCDEFDEYQAVYQVCNSFQYLYGYTMDIFFSEETPYFSIEDRLGYVAEQIEYVYKYSKKGEYDSEEEYSIQHQACMDDLVADMEAFIQTYYHLTDEEIDSFKELSKARRQILLEEGIAENEQIK